MKPRFNLFTAPRTQTFLLWVGAHCVANIFMAVLTFNLIKTADAATVGTYGLLLQQWPLFALQAFVLKRELVPFSGTSWFSRSVVTTIFSMALLGILTAAAELSSFDQLQLVLATGGVVGGGLGLAQSLVLQHYVKRTELWVIASAAALALTGLLQLWLGVSNSVDEWVLLQAPLRGVAQGSITGLVLLLLLRDRLAVPTVRVQQQRKPMDGSFQQGVAFGIMITLVGAIAFLVVGFALSSSTTSRKQSASATQTALAALATPTVVAQATVTPQPKVRDQASIDRAVSEWQPFTSEAGLFKVLLPEYPSEDIYDLSAGYGKQHELSSYSDNGLYMVLYSDRPLDLKDRDAERLFNDITDSEKTSEGVDHLVSQKPLSWQGYPGREIDLALDEGNHVRIWMILSTTHIYEVVTYAFDEEDALDEIDGFLHSFKILTSIDM